MLITQVIGNLSEEAFQNREIDTVAVEWFDAFKKLQTGVSADGIQVAMRFDHHILTKGLRQGDVLAELANGKLLVVDLLPCEVLVITVSAHHSEMIAKVCYEIGNKHAAFFFGEAPNTFITPYNEPTKQLLEKLHGVSVAVCQKKLDFNRSISAVVHSHTH